MGKSGNISVLICQCNGMGKITDVEKAQEIERLVKTSHAAFVESERQKEISGELADKAIQLILSEGIDIDKALLKIKKVFEDAV